jgi:MarR family transcriptional regulator, organic hydroperoxide resistance regulator
MRNPTEPLELADLLAQLHRETSTEVSRILRSGGLPVEQWRVLNALSDGNGRTMSDLASRVFMNLPTLSKAVDRMVTRALVHRKQDSEDHRRVLVYITDFGLELLRQHQPGVAAYYAGLADRLGDRQAAQLNRLLKKVLMQA